MKKIIVDQIEITRNNIIQVRMIKLSSDGDALGYHRTSIEPGVDPDAMLAIVNEHLAQMQVGQLAPDEVTRVRGVVQYVHTPKVIDDFKQKGDK